MLIQTFITDNFILKTKKLYQAKNTPKKESHYMIKKLELTKENFYNINNYCLKNISFISTPYDVSSAIFLNKIKLKTFKVSSADLSDTLLHNVISSFGKRVILSTGMSTISDIKKAIKFYKDKKKLSLLHCVSNYPCSHQSLNLNCISTLKSFFRLPVGFSDHTIDNKSAIISYSIGARIFEKHFTLSKKSNGPDHASSVTPAELKKYISDIYDTKLILGNFKKQVQKEELNMKRVSVKSITLNKDLKKQSTIKLNICLKDLKWFKWFFY